MFKNSMKKFDEVNNILVDVSWRFNTVIIIDCFVFISICSCLISAIRSYNKNVAAAQQSPHLITEITEARRMLVDSVLKEKK